MFDPNKLLGGLLGSGMRDRGLDLNIGSFGGMGGKAAVGMGLLGVAMAAFEHFTDQKGGQSSQPAMGGGYNPAGRPAAPPPPPPTGASAPPPPPPGDAPQAAPAALLPAEQQQSTGTAEGEATLYLRAMIAAAACDGEIDDQERQHIMGKLEESGLSDDERDFLLTEMSWPMGIDELSAAVEDRQQAIRLYISSLLAIVVDTDAEREYLRQLAQALQLPPELLASIHQRFKIDI
jgi:uncharacterized membrane protein YebE (DUF533 family)